MEVVPQPTLGHIFNMDKAEHIFAQLLQHIARQDAELRALRERLDATPDASTLHDALSAARAERLRLERRLDAIEFSTRTPDDAAPIGLAREFCWLISDRGWRRACAHGGRTAAAP